MIFISVLSVLVVSKCIIYIFYFSGALSEISMICAVCYDLIIYLSDANFKVFLLVSLFPLIESTFTLCYTKRYIVQESVLLFAVTSLFHVHVTYDLTQLSFCHPLCT